MPGSAFLEFPNISMTICHGIHTKRIVNDRNPNYTRVTIIFNTPFYWTLTYHRKSFLIKTNVLYEYSQSSSSSHLQM